MTARSHLCLAAAAALALLVADASAQEPYFTGVGDLPGGIYDSYASGVSGDGSVVCGHSNTSIPHEGTATRAFRWTLDDGLLDLGDFPGGNDLSIARAVSADGTTIVGNSDVPFSVRAFRWRAPGPLGTGGMQDLGDLPGGEDYSLAMAVSADGSVVVGHSGSAATLSQLGAEAFRWTDPAAGGTGLQALGDLPGSIMWSAATACSADGSTVGGYSNSSASTTADYEAARWTAATGMAGLGDLPGGIFGSTALGMSADGNTVVGFSLVTDGEVAFRWTNPAAGGTGMQSLGDLAGGTTFSHANGISADGTVVVGESIGSSGKEAFIWTAEDGMRSLKSVLQDELGLDLSGWTLEAAKAISADGRTVVGYGPNPDGHREGWVAHLGAEPPFGTWTDLRHGLAGSFGVPVLSGEGALVAGTPVSFALSGAQPSSPIGWFIGVAELDAPFKGGVLVPAPTLLLLGNSTGPGGGFAVGATWPSGLPSEASLYFQMWIADVGAPFGYSASNGLQATTP